MANLYLGEISVDSQEGKGSTFTVKLPVSKNFFTEEEMATRLDSQNPKHEPIEPVHDQLKPECIDAEVYPARATKENQQVILIDAI